MSKVLGEFSSGNERCLHFMCSCQYMIKGNAQMGRIIKYIYICRKDMKK